MKVLFAAGGTGGHINPALAAAGMVRERHPEAQILFVGTAEKMEARLVPAAGYDFKTIDISGFQRRLTLENIKRNFGTLSKLLKSSAQAKKILLEHEIEILIDLKSGSAASTAWGCDLTYDYVKINGDYRT